MKNYDGKIKVLAGSCPEDFLGVQKLWKGHRGSGDKRSYMETIKVQRRFWKSEKLTEDQRGSVKVIKLSKWFIDVQRS